MTRNATSGGKRGLSRQMWIGGVAPLSSFTLAVFLPLLGRFILPDSDFAMWALLSTVSAVAILLDFGGPIFVAALVPRTADEAWDILIRGIVLSASGSLAVGLVGCIAWVALAHLQPIDGWGALSGSVAFILTALGAMLRSGAVIVASLALLRGDMRLRNCVMIGQALLQVLCTAALAVFWTSAWLFPVGLAASSLLVAVPTILVTRRRLGDPERNPAFAASIETTNSRRSQAPLSSMVRSFALGRTGATALSLVLTQGDRWVIGALGGAGALARYELAWRFAVIPKLLALAISQALVPKAALLDDRSSTTVNSLVRASLVVTSAAVALSASFTALFVAFLLPHFAVANVQPVVSVFAVLLIGHSVHALTAPATMTLNGLGRPAAELPYLGVAALVTLAGWSIALTMKLTVLVSGSVAAGLLAGCTFLMCTRPWSKNSTPSPAKL